MKRLITVCVLAAAIGPQAPLQGAEDVDPMLEAVARELLRQATTNAQRASVMYEAASGVGDDNKALRVYLNERALGYAIQSIHVDTSRRVADYALSKLREDAPERRQHWYAMRTEVYRRYYHSPIAAAAKRRAGQSFAAHLVYYAGYRQNERRWDEATVMYKEAGAVFDALGLPGKTELAILNARATRRAEAYKTLTALEEQYKATPTDAALRRKLACLWIIDLDYAYRATPYTSKTDGSWYTCPRLTASSLTRFYEADKAKLVGDWYFKEVAPLAGPQTRPDMLRRAKTYYEHALALGTKVLRKTTPKADRKTKSKADRTGKLSRADREEIAAALEKITAELNGGKTPEWQIIFRSDDATVWNTDRPTGTLSFAVPLSKVGGPVRYLKLTRRDTSQFVIIPINAMSLDRATSIGKTYGWQGEKYNYGGKATCVGIYSRTLRKSSQRVCITHSYTGWGFGYHRPTKAQGWVWAGKTIDKTSFEIAVFNGDLTPEEAKVLLQ